MAVIITTAPDTGDTLAALSRYLFPDGTNGFTEMHVNLVKKDKNGEEVAKLVSPNKFIIQFTGTQHPQVVEPLGDEALFEVAEEEDVDE